MRKPRRARGTTTASPSPPRSALAAIAIVLLGLTGCVPADPTPSPTVSPLAPSTPAVQPTPVTTTIGPPSSTPVPEISPVPNGSVQWTFVVVRHANWTDRGGNDPLTEAGEARARRLGDLLSTHAGVAVYATDLRRTQDTARPTAEIWGVPVTKYNGALAPAALTDQIKQRHPTGEILIVGHHDTVPGIVGELCRCRVDPIPDADYANRYIVTLGADGSVFKLEHQTGY